MMRFLGANIEKGHEEKISVSFFGEGGFS